MYIAQKRYCIIFDTHTNDDDEMYIVMDTMPSENIFD